MLVVAARSVLHVWNPRTCDSIALFGSQFLCLVGFNKLPRLGVAPPAPSPELAKAAIEDSQPVAGAECPTQPPAVVEAFDWLDSARVWGPTACVGITAFFAGAGAQRPVGVGGDRRAHGHGGVWRSALRIAGSPEG